MLPDALVRTIEAWTRRLTGSLVVEVALVWSIAGEPAGQPTSVILGEPDRVRLTPRDVFTAAVRQGASAVAVVHTHLTDSGPSEDDRAVTRRLVAAGAVLGIPLHLHLVVEPRRSYELIGVRGADQCALPAA